MGTAILPIMNLLLSTGTVPVSFKTAVIKQLLKKPGLGHELYSNCLPISNIPFLSKVQERIVAKQTIDHLTTNNIFEPLHSEFRTFYSTETAVSGQ